MKALKVKNPFTESFLVQLDVDLAGGCVDERGKLPCSPENRVTETRSGSDERIDGCPLMNISDSQSQSPLPLSDINNNPGLPVVQSRPPAHTDKSDTQYRLVPTASSDNNFSLPNRQKSSPSIRNAPALGLLGHKQVGDFASRGAVWQISKDSPGSNEMDTSMDQQSSSHSGFPTPGTSSHKGSSSHTSFTPPDLDESNQNCRSSTDNQNATLFSNQPFGEDFSPTQFFPPTPGKDNESAFVIPPGWELGATGMTPGSGQGMMAMGDGAWSQMLEGMGWEGTGMGGPQGDIAGGRMG